MPLFEQLWFAPAFLLLGLSSLAISVASFRRLAPWLGAPGAGNPWLHLLNSRDEQTALRLGRVVRLASRWTPWKSRCFPQALTARTLLGWHGVPCVVFFGLARDPASGMKAHAWTASGRSRVTGGDGFAEFTVVAFFAAPGLRS